MSKIQPAACIFIMGILCAIFGTIESYQVHDLWTEAKDYQAMMDSPLPHGVTSDEQAISHALARAHLVGRVFSWLGLLLAVVSAVWASVMVWRLRKV